MKVTQFMRIRIIEIITFLFIVLFVYTSASKLFDYENFAAQIGRSSMLTTFGDSLAWGLPLTEIGISILLVFGRTRLAGLYASFSLMILFTAYIILVSRFSDYVPCSCGGVIQSLSWNEHLVLNVSFIALAVTGILLYPEENRPETILK